MRLTCWRVLAFASPCVASWSHLDARSSLLLAHAGGEPFASTRKLVAPPGQSLTEREINKSTAPGPYTFTLGKGAPASLHCNARQGHRVVFPRVRQKFLRGFSLTCVPVPSSRALAGSQGPSWRRGRLGCRR